MNPQKLASWLQTEHTQIDELATRLQERVAVIPRVNHQNWIAEVTRAFTDFRTHVLRHHQLEEQDGYMVAVVEQRPPLAREVERLAHEHWELDRLMADINRQLQELKPQDQLIIRDVCRRIQNLLLYREHHEKEENLLVVSVFLNDLGTDD